MTKITLEEYKIKLKEKYDGKFEVVSPDDDYKNLSSKLKFKCNNCGSIITKSANAQLEKGICSGCLAKAREEAKAKIRAEREEKKRQLEEERNAPVKIEYEPTENDLIHIKEIEDFFNENNIPFVKDEETFGVYHINDGAIQVRYIDSFYYRMDNSKRFGEEFKGIKHSYFVDISHENFKNNIRTIWIFDFEMEQHNKIKNDKGEWIDFRRQWEVIKNTIRTATGHIHYKFYARDCEIREVDNEELRPFLETNCFYGYRCANKNLGLYLKKDKNGFKAGTLMMIYTFGYNFYGNRKREDDPFIEIIRVSTRLECQVVGGASKCLTYFFENYPYLEINKKLIKVNELKFYVDASHNDGRGMNALKFFTFTEWKGEGFMNMWVEDYCSEDGKLKGKKGEIFHRKPMFHKRIMQLIGEGKIVSIANAGTVVYTTTRDEYLKMNDK